MNGAQTFMKQDLGGTPTFLLELPKQSVNFLPPWSRSADEGGDGGSSWTDSEAGGTKYVSIL